MGSSVNEIHGEIDVAGAIAVAGGTTTLHPDCVVTNPGQDWMISGSGTLDCSSSSPIISVQCVTMSGGTITGDNAITSESMFDWTGGALRTPTQFTGDFFANGVMNLHGNASKVLEKRLELRGSGTWSDNGQLWIGAGAILRIMPGSTLDIQTDASLTWSTAPRGTLENNGTLRKTGGSGSQFVSIDISNVGQGNVELLSGTLTMGTPAVYRQASSGATILNGGTLAVNSPTQNPIQLDNGSLMGVGTVGGRVQNNAAAVRPGVNGAGTLTISENYTQAASAALSVELGGAQAGTEHDVLIVNGTASLAGELEVRLINGFTPQVGQNFTILTGAPVNGQFSTLDAPSMPNAHFEVTYGATFVTLTVMPGGGGGPTADLNNDCQVNISDLAILLANFGSTTATHENGDIDGDGDVDISDLALMLGQFGMTC